MMKLSAWMVLAGLPVLAVACSGDLSSGAGADAGAAGGAPSALPGRGPGGSGGGTTPASAGVGTLGAACASPAELACAGNYQSVGLICGASGVWEANLTCAGGEVCDTREGLTLGTCVGPLDECPTPGHRYCDETASVVYECNADATASESVEECPSSCKDGECIDRADPCPEGPFEGDCASECGQGAKLCSDACRSGTMIETEAGGVYRLRTGSGEGLCMSPDCDQRDHFVISINRAHPVRVTVGAGWSIMKYSGDVQCDALLGRCAILHLEDLWATAHLIPDGPDAKSRNVVVEVVDNDAVCP